MGHTSGQQLIVRRITELGGPCAADVEPSAGVCSSPGVLCPNGTSPWISLTAGLTWARPGPDTRSGESKFVDHRVETDNAAQLWCCVKDGDAKRGAAGGSPHTCLLRVFGCCPGFQRVMEPF